MVKEKLLVEATLHRLIYLCYILDPFYEINAWKLKHENTKAQTRNLAWNLKHDHYLNMD